MAKYINADEMKTIKAIQNADFNSIKSVRKWIDSFCGIEIVCCHDCKHYTITGNGVNGICNFMEQPRMRWDYCSFACEKIDEVKNEAD